MSKKFKTEPHDATPKAKRARKGQAAPTEDSSVAQQIPLDPPGANAVTSNSNAGAAAGAEPDPNPPAAMDAAAQPASPAEDKKMEQTLTLTKSTAPRKDERIVIFQGPLHAVQFLRTAFGETVPDTITVTGDFAEPQAPKVPKVKETPEERKARLAALPKPTLEQKVAKAEERAAKLREKLAKKAAEQPSA